jgi:hypothetical protein
MKKINRNTIFFCALVLLISIPAKAQYPEDVLRLSTPGTGIGARALGLGMSYTGVANDFSALYWNPAGLGQLKMNEFSFGMSQLGYSNTGSLYGTGESFSNNSTNINNIGLVYSVPTTQGSFVVAFGYSRQADFTTGLSFQGFNPNSSIIQSWAPDGKPYPSDLSTNLAYQLYLANIDTVNGVWDSKIKNNVTQSGTVIEGGGINNYSAGAALEAAPNVFLGLSLNVEAGSYSYSRNYSENDFNQLYSTPPFDFTSLTLLENVESDIGGFYAKFGLLYKFGANSRIGIAIKTPSWISVHETFSQRATSNFDSTSQLGSQFLYAIDGKDDYDVTTPFVFSLGASYGIQNLMLSGEVEYTDWTQMEFRNASADVMAYNTQIKSEFRPTANLHVGAEYELVPGIFQLRGGFAFLPSPYNGDPSDFAQKYITGGVSFSLQNSIIIELGYAHGMWKNYTLNYDYSVNGTQTSLVSEDITTDTFLGTVSYRF